MGKFLAFCIGIGLLLVSFEGTWRDFVSYDGSFKITVPGQMKEVVHTVKTGIGSLEYHVFAYRTEDDEADNLMYMVSYVDYPSGTIHQDSTDLVDDFLDATMEEAALSVNGEIIYSSPIQEQGFPGRLWRTDFGNGAGVIRTKAFISGNRYYSIQTACDKNKSLNHSTDRFLNSFTLLSESDKMKIKSLESNNGATIPLTPYGDNHSKREKDGSNNGTDSEK